MSGVFSFHKEICEKAGRGRRYGDISGRDKEEGVCVKGSDYPGQKTSASDSGDWNGSAGDERIH